MSIALSEAAQAVMSIILAASLFVSNSPGKSLLSFPLPKAHIRTTPLDFGLYVTPDPEQNPLKTPERFTGYHTGVDFEVFESEKEKEHNPCQDQYFDTTYPLHTEHVT